MRLKYNRKSADFSFFFRFKSFILPKMCYINRH